MTFQEFREQIQEKGWGHWVTALVLTIVGVYLGIWLGEHQYWINLRYLIYQSLLSLTPQAPFPQRTVIVEITDEEYWKGEPARRRPIKRDYLAKIIRALDKVDPAAIAIDFDLRSPVPDGSIVESPDYVKERDELLSAIRDVAANRPIVIPRTIALDVNGHYHAESDIFSTSDFEGANVLRGYIALARDVRQIPLSLDVGEPKRLDSFSEAVARAVDPDAAERIEDPGSIRFWLRPFVSEGALPYGTYMSEDDFKHVTFTSTQILNASSNELHDKIAHRVAFIGAAWRSLAYGRGPRNDAYATPVGITWGVMIHANYVESILKSLAYRPPKEGIVIACEVIVVIALAVVLAVKLDLRLKAVLIAFWCLALIIVGYFFLQNLGFYLDFFVPLVLVLAHLGVDRILEWRHLAHQHGPP